MLKLQAHPPRIPMDFTSRSLRGLNASSQSSGVSISGNMFRKGGIRYLWVTPSVYGGAGGHGTRISVSSHLMNYGYDVVRGNLLLGNEKMTMQNLNDRLANYLQKVSQLEQVNIELEGNIKLWYKQKSTISPDNKTNETKLNQIQDLQNQIKEAQLTKGRWILKVDNCKLAAEDYKLKYETEKELRLVVEADTHRLRTVIDELTLHKTDLEIQIEHLNKYLILLNKEHQEEVKRLNKHLGSTINVELKAAPGRDLSAIMDKMRQEYEALAKEHLQRAKQEFQAKTEILQQEVTLNTEELKEFEVQMKELTHTYQEVDTELKSQLRMKDSLEHKLQTTTARFNNKLADLEAQATILQAQLTQIRREAKQSNQNYQELLGIKIQLEQEIATYCHLLEGRGDTIYKKTRMIKTEELVDGKIVSSQVQQMEENM